MAINKKHLRNTLLFNVLSCLAYEAIRIAGWQHRHAVSGGVWDPGGSDPTLLEIAVETWEPGALLMYLAFLSPLFVVVTNNQNPRIQKSWFIVSIVAFVAISAFIPFSKSTRYLSTDALVAMIYVVVILLPAIGFIIYGTCKITANKRP